MRRKIYAIPSEYRSEKNERWNLKIFIQICLSTCLAYIQLFQHSNCLSR